MAGVVDIDAFISYMDAGRPVIDVRSPSEYMHAHIPGAVSIPLFDDDERASVGTIYTKQSKVKAVQKGLEFVGPKLKRFSDTALSLGSKDLLVYCWRGGMRSGAMSWLFEMLDLKCVRLEGGYKSYRSHVLDSFRKEYKLIVVGGCTGSGKTDLLSELACRGEQVIDLEALACHKGSAFGSMGEDPQPSSEYFEHLIFDTLRKFDRNRAVWIEDESANVGRVFVPRDLFLQMRCAPMLIMNTSYQARLARIMRVYAAFPPDQIAPYILKIEKRMGPDRCKRAYEACLAGDVTQAAVLCLEYYDKSYRSQLEGRRRECREYVEEECREMDVRDFTDRIIDLKNKFYRDVE